MPVYGSSRDDFANATWILLEGQFKVGKTIAAATFSERCPDELPAILHTELDDMYWCQFDKKGVESLGAMRLEAPRCDLSGDCADFDKLLHGIKDFHLTLAKRVQEKKTRTLVVDTISALDVAFVHHMRKQFDVANNPNAYYTALLSRHMDFVNPIRALDINVIFISHITSQVAFMEAKETESERQRRKAGRIGGDDGAKQGADITGKAGRWYKGQCSNIWPIVAIVEKNKPTIRKILPYGGQGYEGGCRYHGLNPEGEPAHLGQLFRKIRSLAA